MVALSRSREKQRLPYPKIMAPFVGVVEIGCGALLILGLLTRVAGMALIIDMLVAIATTKILILMKSGFWAMAHEARTDYAMLLGRLRPCLTTINHYRADKL
jgi:putative oxidoreductase